MARNSLQTRESPLKKVFSTLIMLSAFGGLMVLGWFAYEEGKIPHDLSEIPLIKSNPNPFKIKPKDSGGMKIKNTDKTVYNAISARRYVDMESKKVAIDILPPPEEPVTREELAKVPAPFLIRRKTTASEIKHKNSRKYKVISISGIPDTPERKRKKEDKATAKASAVKQKPEGYWIQLGSYKEPKNLEYGWKVIKSRFPHVLGNLKHEMKEVTIRSRGVFFRLQAGSIDSRAKADKLCKELRNKKQGCLIAR